MQIPMIFFTITIQRRIRTPQELEQRYLQDKLIAELEEKRLWDTLPYPESCKRL
ncbi:YrzI family small protein [Brevibacillus humidisoli]|uniref:YrzI family small protein n=1 Tax=Brevibacillus humidisoli TaxID=2895522 RepID=UPI001E4A4311|nr:YrzI family small protein [Brevibacillus humidisoli]UFJ41276.1 YrzI family small protein [Brevibacillus humidisoli]